MSFHALVILSVIFKVSSASVHEIQLPGSKSVKIIDDEASWDDSDRRTTGNSNDRVGAHNDPDSEENFDQYALEKFLNTYTEKFRKKYQQNSDKNNDNLSEEDQESSASDKEVKSKRWNMMNVQKHKHPFEDKNGWVSLDPVPWSLSKISKWHSEKKPNRKPELSYDAIEKPWEADLITSEYDDLPSKPSWYQKPRPYKVRPSSHYKPIQVHTHNDHQNEEEYEERPTILIQGPDIEDSNSYDHKVQIHYNTDSGYVKRPTLYTHRYDARPHKNCDHSSEEIITDGLPSNFPNNPYNRRKSSVPLDNHPFGGNGDWVLLSTTKGYKSPQTRQRSLQITLNPMHTSSESTRKSIQVVPNSSPSNSIRVSKDLKNTTDLNQKEPDSVGVRRGVKLTVLPPLKNSKVNMTTSHGGLLQVESTFETVEESQQRHARKVKDNTRRKPMRIRVGKNKVIRRPAVQRLNVALPLTSLNDRVGSPDISAVLAAAGAGMIPATMAMLVPMAMGRKRRRRRDLSQFEQFLS